MKIYTKTGDKGQTSLIGGTRVSKADLRLDTYGTADELNSFVGLLRAEPIAKDVDELLATVQNTLFNLGAYLATEPTTPNAECRTPNAVSLTPADVQLLEQAIDTYTSALSPLRGFILPAGNRSVALAHVCRTITRRLERRMVELLGETETDFIALQYVNRLSDLCFVLARKIAQDDKCDVFLWKK